MEKITGQVIKRDYIFACVDCGRDFTLTEGECDFYTGRSLSLPKRCSVCRKTRRDWKEKNI
jgi:Probable zinc-ribbon domain